MIRYVSFFLPLLMLNACHNSSNHSDLQAGRHIKSYESDANGTKVTCKNGLVEHTSHYEILSNQVCKLGYFMEVKGNPILMSETDEERNCDLSSSDGTHIVYLSEIPKKVGDDYHIAIDHIPEKFSCYLKNAILLDWDLGKVRFGQTDGVTVEWLSSVAAPNDGTSTPGQLIPIPGTLKTIEGTLVDAVQAKTGNLIYYVTKEPHALVAFNTETQESSSIPLLRTPTALDVSLDGKIAVVGHDAFVSKIDLESKTILNTFDVHIVVSDIVINHDKTMAYPFEGSGSWAGLHQLNLVTGKADIDTSMTIHGNTVAKLHPNGKAIYGADNHVSPSDIEKYDVSGESIKVLYDSKYHGDYAVCGNLWISELGERIFTACGNIFTAKDTQDEDLLYHGSVGKNIRITSLDDSASKGIFVTVHAETQNYWGSSQKPTLLGVYASEITELKKSYDLNQLFGEAFDPKHVFIDEAKNRALIFAFDGTKSGIFELPISL